MESITLDLKDQNLIKNLTQQITNMENRIKSLESSLQVTTAGVVLKSNTGITIQSGTTMKIQSAAIMEIKGAMIQLN